MDLLHELSELLAALDGAGVEYALCGALALAVHGVPRATMRPSMSPEDVTRRVAEALELGRALPLGRPRVDMSPEAVTGRLEEVSTLSALCRELEDAGREHRARGSRRAQPG